MPDTASSPGGQRSRVPLRFLMIALLALAATRATSAASAVCDVPTLGPVDIVAGAVDGGKHLHIVTGAAAICDVAATRGFEVALPNLHELGSVRVQLVLAGFVRRYGVHQISFTLASVDATPSPGGVTVHYTAAIDGLDRYQLAYTLYLVANP